jgi:hypothetical protein
MAHLASRLTGLTPIFPECPVTRTRPYQARVEGKSCIGVFEPSATAALQADKPQAFTVCSDFRSWHKADELDGSL